MERNEISLHEVKVYRVFKGSPDKWLTNAEVANAGGLKTRTARWHTMRFAALGIIERAEVFPSHKFKLSSKAGKRNGGFLQRLEQADKLFQ